MVLTALLVLTCAARFASSNDNLSNVTYLAATLGAAIVAFLYARRLDSTSRVAWLWIAGGLLFSAVGDVIYTVLVWQRGLVPDASLADLFWLGAYIALGVGLLAMLGLHHREPGQKTRYDIDGLVDLVSFAILAIIVVSQVTDIGEVFTYSEVSLIVQLIWAAYPVLDAALLAVLIRAIISRRVHGTSGALLGFGIACWLGSDLATLLIADASVILTWMDIGWMVGAAGMAAGAIFQPRVARVRETTTGRHGEGARVLISLAPLLLPSLIETWAFMHDKDANPIPFLVAMTVLVGLACLRSIRLVRARDLHETALIANKRYYQALAQNSADAVVVVDAFGRIKSDGSQLATMVGKSGNAIGADVIDLLHPANRADGLAALDRVRASGGTVHEFDFRAGHADGDDRWFAVRAVNMLDDPNVKGIIINVHDATDRKRAEEELTHRAFHDGLTGLANRALFLDRVEHALRRSTSGGADVAVIYLDIDGFKTVNDSRGHESGDHTLREIAHRLVSAVRTGDTVARLGGDEFAILIDEGVTHEDEGCAAANRILAALKPPMQLDEHCVMLSASIGITYGDPHATASSMLRDADIAMYKSKTGGKSRWTVYDKKMRLAALERVELETDLVTALQRQQFELVYQPIIELHTEEVVGFEALLRWNHPTRGAVQPDAFIPIAEENGCIVQIGEWVLDEACRMGAKFQAMHPTGSLTMAINLSTRQIATVEIVDHVKESLLRSGFPAHSLVLEMTESALVEDATTAATRLHQLRALGVRLAIDDFGTGYSSLSYLRQFPIDILKIDRSFISSITDPENIPAIVRGLLDLGKTLQLETVAEGIELDVQRDMLREQNCGFGQGFLFARPLSVSDCEAMLVRLDDRDLVP